MTPVKARIAAAFGVVAGLGLATTAVAECQVAEERAPVMQAVAEGLSDFCFDPLHVLERSAPSCRRPSAGRSSDRWARHGPPPMR